MIRVLIVDDEQPARLRLKKMLSEFHNIKIVDEASNGLEALEKIELYKLDLIFLDIEMPELNGIEIAKMIPDPNVKIVFATAYDEYAIQAFDANAIDYLLKPFSQERLEKCMQKMQINSSFNATLQLISKQKNNKKLAIKVGKKYQIIDQTEISAIIATNDYSTVRVMDKEYLCDDSLDLLISRLNSVEFTRIHRGSIININYLQELRHLGDRKYLAILKDFFQTELAVSRGQIDELKQRIGL